ncbi:hypothetical protein N7499_011983 [Penicillium canescens]|nr:hypothetical protein N7499_011983 [Penicillium canescens]KAJ6181853.1 hypothetical protein N7485_000495 [Penicillium canescens]
MLFSLLTLLCCAFVTALPGEHGPETWGGPKGGGGNGNKFISGGNGGGVGIGIGGGGGGGGTGCDPVACDIKRLHLCTNNHDRLYYNCYSHDHRYQFNLLRYSHVYGYSNHHVHNHLYGYSNHHHHVHNHNHRYCLPYCRMLLLHQPDPTG